MAWQGIWCSSPFPMRQKLYTSTKRFQSGFQRYDLTPSFPLLFTVLSGGIPNIRFAVSAERRSWRKKTSKKVIISSTRPIITSSERYSAIMPPVWYHCSTLLSYSVIKGNEQWTSKPYPYGVNVIRKRVNLSSESGQLYSGEAVNQIRTGRQMLKNKA